jgi:hypothetical protein
MNRALRALMIVGVGSFIGLASASTASAQVDAPMTFKTWFPFTVNGTTLQPGTYMIRPLSDQTSVLELSSRDGRHGIFFGVQPIQMRADEAAQRSEIVFLRSGEQYVLKDVWVAGEDIGAETHGKLTEDRRTASNGTMTSPEEVRVAVIAGGNASRMARS